MIICVNDSLRVHSANYLTPNVTCTNVVKPLNKIVVDNNLAFNSSSSRAQVTSATNITSVRFHGNANSVF